MKEIWKSIEENPIYEVSNLGNIRKFEYDRYYKLYPSRHSKQGYMNIGMTTNKIHKKYLVHRLVAKAFIPNPENKPQVNHKNGINTDNRVSNLEWVTMEENIEHSIKNGLQFKHLNSVKKNDEKMLTSLADNDTMSLTDIDRKGDMNKDKGSGRRIFEETMNSRVTVRLDKQHVEKLEQVMSEKNLNSMSEAIRYLIEKQDKKDK